MKRAQSNRRRGRPARSATFQLVPVRHDSPNARKLGRAFLALAIHRAQSQVDLESAVEEGRDGTA